MILTGPEIAKQIKAKKIVITPFKKGRVNPNSYDLSLGREVGVYEDWVECFEVPGVPKTLEDGRNFVVKPDMILDTKKKPHYRKFKIDPTVGWVLRPGIGYLMHTEEVVHSSSFVPVLDGKSSIGRLFISVHETAGYGDIGFSGQYTLEVTVKHALRVYPGMRFCQIRFHEPKGEIQDYGKAPQTQSHYKGENAKGPVPSMVWKQFEDSLS
jgi:dCTP deaminase